MAKLTLLSLALFWFLVSSSCFAERQQQQQQGQKFNECQLDNLDALEPDNRIDAEAGRIESWNPNHQQFRCAGVAFMKTTIERNGLYLPVYNNAPTLIYVIRGNGVFSVVIPGCAETFEESKQQGGQSRRLQDRHQKIRQFREGDILAVPAGVAYWLYNHGDSPIVTVSLIDTSNVHNQLDQTPRKFFLAGNPRQPFEQQARGQSMRTQTGSQGNNMFSGFDTEFLAEILNMNTETVRRLQGQKDNRKNIVRVEKGELGIISPATSREERQLERERESYRGSRDNGFEETICSMRLRENIGDSSRADIFNPRAGRLATLNSHNLPILNWLQLSAEKGTLYENGIFVPHWEINAHSIMYCTRGRGRIQVVDHNGNNVFNGELREGQVLTVPQNFAVAKQAGSEGFEYIAFKTNDNAMVSPLMGRTSVLRGMPVDVLSNAFQIPNDQARRLKEAPDVTFLVSSRQSKGRYDA